MADLHGDFKPLFDFANSEEGNKLKKDSFVIVLGDFGCWPDKNEELKILNQKLNYTLLFIDGNHEHFPFLNSFPVGQKFGGKIHDVYGIYHLCRGEVFEIPVEGRSLKVAVCGGGDSKDKEKRTEGVDWFPEEQINQDDERRMIENAHLYNMNVDVFLSHSLSSAVKTEWQYESFNIPFSRYKTFDTSSSDYIVRNIIGQLNAGVYYSAHEHMDRQFNLSGKMYRSVYKDIVRL